MSREIRSPVHIMENVVFYDNFSSLNVAVRTDGSLWSWGNTYGCPGFLPDEPIWLGNGTEEGSLSPVRIMDDVDTFISIISGERGLRLLRTIFVIKTDGSLWAWANNNEHGILGDGTTENRFAPVQIIDDVASFMLMRDDMRISTNGFGNSIMVIKTDGSLWAWGENRKGQLGDGTTNDLHSPVHIADNVKELLSYGIFIKTDNSLWVFGVNTPDGSLIPYHVMDDVDTVSGNFGSIEGVIKTDGTIWRFLNGLGESPKQFILSVPA